MKEKIKNIIIEWQEFFKFPDVITRDVALTYSQEINCIIGLRRTGKTYLLFSEIQKLLNSGINKKNILYLNFDDERLNFENQNFDFDLIIESYFELYPEIVKSKIYMFFDEIQNYNGWELFIKRLFEKKQYHLTITGSSSKLLSAEIATQLRGRTLTYKLYTLNFEEFLKFQKLTIKKNDLYSSKRYKISKLAKEYLEFGGFPRINNEKNHILKKQILNDYLDMIIFKDIVERYAIRNTDIIRLIIQYVLHNSGREFSINSFYNKFKKEYNFSKDTIFNYFSYLEDVGFLYYIQRYSSKMHLRYGTKKIFIADNGFLQCSAYSESDTLCFKFESLICGELLKKNLEVFFYKTDTSECDFIIAENKKIKSAIQVCYELTKQNENREINGVLEALKHFKIKHGQIITYSQERIIKKNGYSIEIIPYWKWMLLAK